MNLPELFPAALRRVGLRAFIYGAGDVVAHGIALLLLPIYTRVLTTEEYGTYGVVLALVAVLNVIVPLQMQTSVTVQYFSVEPRLRRGLVSAAVICLLISTLLVSIILFASRQHWGSAMFAGRPPQPYVEFAIVLAALTASGAIPQALMRMREQAALSVAISAGTYVLSLGLGLYLLTRHGMGVRGLLLGAVIGVLMAMPVYALYMRNEFTLAIPRGWLWNNVVVAVPLVPHLLAHWSLSLLDRLILPRFVPLSDVGIYQLGYQAAMVFQIIVLAVNSTWVPYAFQRLGRPSAANEVRRMSTWLVYGQAWLGLAAALFVPEIIVLAVTPSFQKAVTVVPWVVLGFFMLALYHLWVNLLLFRKQTAFVPAATIGAAITNLALNVVLIPRLGYIGAAITTAISYTVLAALTAIMVRRLGLSFPFEYSRWLLAAVVAVVLFLLGSQAGEAAVAVRWVAKLAAWFAFPILLGIPGLGGSGMVRGLLGLVGSDSAGGKNPQE